MMSVLYVFTSASSKPGSVQKKVISQIKAMNASGMICKGLFFTTDEVKDNAEQDIRFVHLNRVGPGYFRSARQRTAYHKAVYDFFETCQQPFDFVYYRYPGAHRLLTKLSEKLGHKLFFEHVTAETNEIRLYRKENPMRFKLSSMLSHFEFYFLPLYREWRFGKRIRQLALMGICNSKQIADYECRLAGGRYKTFIQGDAVDVTQFNPRKVPVLESDFRMVFLKGGGTGADFNGLDKVFRGIAAYNGPYRIRFYLYGSNLKAEREQISALGIEEQVITGDFIQKAEADLLMDTVHIGIGALAVHRKGITETTTIKTREYCARGLPFISGHSDPDFTGNAEAGVFNLELPANDDKLDLEAVIKWYKSLNFNAASVMNMHNFAVMFLSYHVKMKRLKTFLLSKTK
jgi:hypothetical protein